MTYLMYSLGCKVNSYELSSLSFLLNEKGYVEDKNNPDVLIVNTCSVTATADQKSRQHIRSLKTKFPNALVVVMGCYSQKAHRFIFNELNADIVTGTSKRKEAIELIDLIKENKKKIDITEDNPRFFSYEELGLASCSENIRAYLKIQDGCDNFCSYCLIPFVRGKNRSRPFENIIEEAKFLIKSGYKEIVLTGIHVGGYGNDIPNMSFSKLVKSLLDLPGLYRLRISSIEESEIDDELIDLFINNDKLAKHLHIPLQSGCDQTLLRMNRKYSTDDFYKKVSYIKSKVKDLALTTDVIVGFPGENEEEFNQTFNFIKKCGFDMLHVFPFSPRENTKAMRMKEQISPDIKNKRKQILLDYSKESWEKFNQSFLNKQVDVLVEKRINNNQVVGHTTNYLEITVNNTTAKPGDILNFTITNSSI